MQKIIFIVFFALIAMFIYQLKYGDGGEEANLKLLRQINSQAQLNHNMSQRNSMLELKIASLKGSVDSLEARARYELNLVKPGETLVVLPGNYTIKVKSQTQKK